jgi:hypothetical protein
MVQQPLNLEAGIILWMLSNSGRKLRRNMTLWVRTPRYHDYFKIFVARMPVPKFIRELVFVTGSLGSRMTV